MAADGEDGEEDCRARAASRQLISGEEREATAAGLAVTFDLCGEGQSGARTRRRRHRRMRCRGREKGNGDSAGAFYEKILDVLCNSKQVQCSGEEWTAGWIFYFDRVVFVKP